MSVNSKMTALADEIRELSGTTTTKGLDAMTSDVDAANTEISEQMELIAQISTALEGKAAGGSGVTLPELDNPAGASDILSGKEAIDGSGNKITGTITTKTSSNLSASGATVTVPAGYYATQATKSVATATQATPSVSIDANGKITASATQTAGYVSAGTKSGTKQLATKAATTYTPSTSNQTIASGTYLTGTQTIKGDANLKAANIASGVSIFGVTGTHSGSEDLDSELTTQENLISQLSTILDNKASGGTGGNVEYEIVNLTSSSVSIPFTLKRITATYGINTENGSCRTLNIAHQNTRAISVQGDGLMAPRESFLRDLVFSNNSLQSGTEFFAPYTAVFINDPSQSAIYEATT